MQTKREVIDILYNQMMENTKMTIHPLYDSNAHTREEFLKEANRVEIEIKNKTRFWKFIDKLFK